TNWPWHLPGTSIQGRLLAGARPADHALYLFTRWSADRPSWLADLRSICPSGCRPPFGRTSVPFALRAVGRPSGGPQFHLPFGLSAALRADLRSICPSGCRPPFGRTSGLSALRAVGRPSGGPQVYLPFGLSAALRA